MFSPIILLVFCMVQNERYCCTSPAYKIHAYCRTINFKIKNNRYYSCKINEWNIMHYVVENAPCIHYFYGDKLAPGGGLQT